MSEPSHTSDPATGAFVGNPELARRYLKTVFGDARGYVAMAAGFGGHFTASDSYEFPEGAFQEDFYAWPDEAGRIVDRAMEFAPKADIYVCPVLRSKRSRRKGDGLPARVLWADLDEIIGPELVGFERDLVGPTGFLIDSGGPDLESLHVYLALDELLAPEEIERWNQRLAARLAADSGWSETKYLRLPGTFNHKGRARGEKSRLVCFLPFDPAPKDWTLDELGELLPEVPILSWNGAAPLTPAPVPDRLPRHITDRLHEAPGEDRSAQMHGLIAACICYGYSDGETYSLALGHEPTIEKYGDRAGVEIERSIAKVRPGHDHIGQPCDKAECPNAPTWMQGPAGNSSATGRSDNDVHVRGVDDVALEADAPAEQTPVTYALTDLGNAELFAGRNAEQLRHVKERRQWLVWSGQRWKLDVAGAAERAAKDVARELLRRAADVEDDDRRKKAIGWAQTSQSEPRIRAMLSLASTEPELVLRPDQLDTDPFLFACGNGVIDLQTGLLRSPDPADLISLGTDVAYDPDATCPRFEQFLDEVFSADAGLTNYMQRLIGYVLTGDTREQLVIVLHGGGGNGKDTLITPIMRVLGDHALTCPFDTFSRSRGDRGVRNDLARLHRARLVVASESAEDKQLDEPVIKLVSGGGRIPARFLYSEYFEYVPMFKVFLITNHKPRIDGDDDAIWRRLRLIPFEENFIGREDKLLDKALEEELPGILAWAVRGCLEWQRDGLGLPAVVKDATLDYRAEEDVLGTFIAERCALTGQVEPADFRAAYETFSKGLDERPLTANVIGKRLSKRGIRRATRDGKGVYLGIELLS